jgi:hypothetical protein
MPVHLGGTLSDVPYALIEQVSLIIFTMDPEADRQKAMAAVRAMFERYKVLAARRPKDHVVSSIISLCMLSH